MSLNYNIFSIKPSEFDQGQEDPFSFNAFSEKLSNDYLPFSGTVRKPIYFFFVQYVNWLWETGKFKSKKKKEIRIRLEKLLVLSWKRNTNNLIRKNILGSRQKKINPYKGNDGNWIVQTCFEIYGASAKKIISDDKFIQRYIKDNQGEENILNEFLNKDGLLDKRNETILEKDLRKLSTKKYSLFSGKDLLQQRYKVIFKKYLIESIKKTNKDYYNDIYSIIHAKNKIRERIYKKTIENEKKYPFKKLNKWFSAFVFAVDKDLNNDNSDSYWKKADSLYNKIPDREKKYLIQRPEPRCWFERIGQKYTKKHGKEFDENGWNAVLKRANSNNFYDFKHDALISLIQEIN